MKYKIFLHPKAAEFLKNLNSSLRIMIKNRLKELEESPEEKGQRLRYSSFYRLRIRDYRAIYEIIKEGKVIVLFIGHRRTVYDDFSRIL